MITWVEFTISLTLRQLSKPSLNGKIRKGGPICLVMYNERQKGGVTVKRHGNFWDKLVSMDNIELAYENAKKNKIGKDK
jgi:hypothetical protein